MKTVKALFEELDELVLELSKRSTEPDEFIAYSELNAAVNKTKEVFKRTKDINGE